MSKVEYSVEDFVLDPEFRTWVLNPTSETKIYWEEYIKKNPSKYQDIILARKILLNLARKTVKVTNERIEATWANIDMAVDQINADEFEDKIIPINSNCSIEKYPVYRRYSTSDNQLLKMVAILAITIMLGICYHIVSKSPEILVSEDPIEYNEHIVPPGVKSHLTLTDGSKVILNSGSSLKYIKNFKSDRREVELVGEAFFEIVRDVNRPFIVKTGMVSTEVLGTSFNVRAFENEVLEVALLTGQVEVNINLGVPEKINLVPGEALRFTQATQDIKKGDFDKVKVLAWTQKTLVFEEAKMYEIKRVLENWYGVDIKFLNKPAQDLEISARFKDQSLKEVLEGLSHSARFNYDIKKDIVMIKFN